MTSTNSAADVVAIWMRRILVVYLSFFYFLFAVALLFAGVEATLLGSAMLVVGLGFIVVGRKGRRRILEPVRTAVVEPVALVIGRGAFVLLKAGWAILKYAGAALRAFMPIGAALLLIYSLVRFVKWSWYH